MNIKLILFLFTGLIYSVFAQTLLIKDKETGVPLEFVNIYSEYPKIFTTTNIEGLANISMFKNVEKIEFRRLGYKTEILSYSELSKMDFELLLNINLTQFDEVVVSATGWKQTTRNISSKISIISQKDLALYNPQTAADLLTASGEVFIQKSQQGGGSPMIRGYATNRLLYTVDGIRMNSAIFRAGNIQNVISLDPFAIENTEVLFGPGSIIYGSDAIGGVMSFQTLSPQLSLTDKTLITGKAVSRFSSANNEITNHFDIILGWNKWASVTSFTYSKFGDLKMGRNGPDEYFKKYFVQTIDGVDKVFNNPDPLIQNPSGYSQINMMQKFRFTPNNNWDFQYGFHYSETTEYSRYDRLIEKQSNGLPISAVWNYGPQVWMMNNFSILNSDLNKFYDNMIIRFAHQYFEESRIDRKFNHHRLRTQLEKVNAYSMNIDFEKSINKHRFYYGTDYVLNHVKSNGTAIDIRNGKDIQVSDRYPLSDWISYAGYFNYQHLTSDKFLFQSGLRFTAFKINSDFTRHLSFFPFDFKSSSISNSALTGSIGFIYTPDESWKISANLSSGFRAPNVDDIGKIFDFASGEVVVPNTSLKAEYVYNAELSIAKIIDNFIKLDATIFYSYLDNAMVRRAFQVNGKDSILYNGILSKVYAIQNAAFARVFGFNVGFEINLSPGLGISTRYNYQYGEEEMDNGRLSPSRHAAPSFGVTKLFFQKDKLSLQLNIMYSAEVSYEQLNEEERQKPFIYAKDNNNKPYSPSWYSLNFKASYNFVKYLTITGGIDNITDQCYRPYSSGLVAPGRNFIISLRANF